MSPEMPVLPRWMVALLAAILLALIVCGVGTYRAEERAARNRVFTELNTIGRLKVDQITAWRRDRLRVAASLSESPFLSEGITDYLLRPEARTERAIRARLQSLQRQQDLAAALLLDRDGQVRLAVGPLTESPGALRPAVAEARRTLRPAIADLHTDGGNPPHLSVVAPILSGGARPGSVAAFVVLVSDAARFLFPLIQSWPAPSPSAETLLVRRDGDAAMYLNELRHREGAALKLRVPLAQTDLPAVMAVLGREGPMEGRDYRDVPVVSVLLPVPDSPWFMVAKVDADEYFADWHARAILLALLIGGLGVLVVGVGLIAWQRGAKRHYRSLYQAEAALRATVERHSTTLRSIGDGVIATDTHGRVELINPVAEQLTGWTEAEGRGRPLADVFRLVNDDTRAEVGDPVARVLRDGAVVALDPHTLLVARDGTERPITDSGAPIRDSQGSAIGVVLVFRDQSERRAANRALLESAEALQDSQRIAGVGSYALDIATGRWVSSDVLDTIFGIGDDYPRTVDGWRAMIHPDERTAMTEYLVDEVIGRGRVFDREYRIVRPADGAERWVHGHGRVSLDSAGVPVRMIGTIQDVTSWKQAARDRATLQEELQQAQKMESIGRLAGGVAHDFNNMISAILGYSDLALAALEPTSPVRADLAEIQKAAEHSADLTRQLLAFARRQMIAPRVIDLNETIEGMIRMLRRLIGEDVELVWRKGAELWPVRMDPNQVDQILANLCVNARDAIAGAGHITLETRHAAIDETYCAAHAGFEPGDYVRLSVSDDGGGMSKEVLDHLFEPFFTTKPAGEGTGLGLATVYGIVKQNDGFINVYSEPGLGTTFSIYLRRYTGADAPAAAAVAASQATRGGGETVLIVEDEDLLLKVTATAVADLGYEVLTAPSPAEALRISDTYPGRIDLLLTDVVMPGMDGRELAVRLRARRPEIACLYMSGYAADVIVHHGVVDDGVQFIQKPFTAAGLSLKLREALTLA